MENTTVTLLQRIVEQNNEIISLLAKQAVPLEAGEHMQAAAGSNIVYTIGLGTIKDIVNAPAGTFQPEFQSGVCEKLKNIAILRERPKEPGTKGSGNYKKIKAEA